MAFVDNVSLILEKLNYSFSLCDDSKVHKKLFGEYGDIGNEPRSAQHLGGNDSDTSVGMDNSAGVEDLLGNVGNKNKKGNDKQAIAKCRYVHWKESADTITDESKDEMFSFVELKRHPAAISSKLSTFVQKLIQAESNFSAYASYGSSTPADDSSILEFTVTLVLDLKKGPSTTKVVHIKESCTISQMIGYILYLSEVEDFRANLKLGVDNYKLYVWNSSLPDENTKPLNYTDFARDYLHQELLLKFDPADIVAKIVFSTKTSTAYHESQPYSMSLNFHLKDVLVRYLSGRKLRTDGGFDVYIYPSKTYINEIDVPMLNFKDFVDEDNKLCFAVVYYDDKKPSEVKTRNEESSTFDLYRRASLHQKFKQPVEVNVGIDGSKIEIVPISTSTGFFNKVKPILIDLKQVNSCVIVNIKSDSKKQLKIKYESKKGSHSVVVVAPYYEIQEMNQKINDILTDRDERLKRANTLFQ